MNDSLKKRIQSFRHAFRGVRTLFAATPNARIHAVAAVAAVALGFVLRISWGEWLAVVIVIGMVFAAEALNTAIETLADYACDKQIHPMIKAVKDLSAAAVLLAAIAALVVGLVVFLPKIIQIFL